MEQLNSKTWLLSHHKIESDNGERQHIHTMRDFFIFGVCLGGMAVTFLIWGVLLRMGYLRVSYAIKGNPVFAPPALLHSLIFLGLAIGSLAIGPLIPSDVRLNFGTYVFGPLIISVFVFAIWQPWWLKPAWLRWLEKEHGDIIEILWEEVRKEGHAWERRVRTQAQLEAWAAEVRRKRGLE